MSEKEPTQEETPLHEVVLKLMFEANKEKPAELTTSEVSWKITDPSISDRNVAEVLNWLVNQKRVEQFTGKYRLDRFEFLEQRSRDVDETHNPKKELLNSGQEKIPLHEVVLSIMFSASKEKPAELTANDIFWKSSDPTVSEGQITEVLNWLVNQRKVDHFTGKYSLDRFEFLEQKNAEDDKVLPKKEVPKKTPKTPKLVPKETPPKKKVPTPKLEPPKKETPPPSPKPQPKEIVAPIEVIDKVVEDDKSKTNRTILIVAAGLFLYTCYLMLSLTESTPPISTQELTSIVVKLFLSNSLILLLFGVVLYRRS